jgi:hypothetical protein
MPTADIPPPEDPPQEDVGGEEDTSRSSTEGDGSGAVGSGSGGAGADAPVISSTMRAAVLEALSDPAVVRQLAAAVSNSSSFIS